jgi:FkbM family methyltransferase
MIPIIIISYNNYKYVENTVKQIAKLNEEYLSFIFIMDNCSTDEKTKEYLKNCPHKVIYNKENSGPWVNSNVNADVYNQMPDEFILTDADLQFNEKLPKNFIEVLSSLSKKYTCSNIGFALDISDYDKMFKGVYFHGLTIHEWERRFWTTKQDDENYELYKADLDTTFCLINKKHKESSLSIRVAGDFVAKHIPWYMENEILNIYELYSLYKYETNISTTGRMIIPFIEKTYSKVEKRNEIFFFKNEYTENLSFLTKYYVNWEKETFDIFDKYLNKDKSFIDIGAWIGTTCMYGSRKSKHVYCVEADHKSFADLKRNCKVNCIDNLTFFYNAIFNKDDTEVMFGKNKFKNNTHLNDSMSQICLDKQTVTEDYYFVPTITVKKLMESVNPLEISLIKVDIEGGEENILQDLYDVHNEYSIPLFVSFHYSWWNDKNIDRFTFLTEEQKNKVKKYPFTSLLFVK